MKRVLGLVVFLLAFYATALAQRQNLNGWCEKGNETVLTDGRNSTTKVQRSYPSCTVTVFDAGTLNLSTIASDIGGTPKANPFTADTNGFWNFWAVDGRYDVRISGSGLATPFTFANQWVISTSGGTGDVVGPGFADNNAIARYSGTSGKLIKNSSIQIGDDAIIVFPDNVRQTFNPGATNAGFNPGQQTSDPSVAVDGDVYYNTSLGTMRCRVAGVWISCLGTGNVSGPGSSTDNAIVRWDGTTGQLIQNSTVIVGDTGNITGVGTLNSHTIPGGTDTFAMISASQVLSNKLLNNSNSFSSYYDMTRIGAPANPAPGNLRIFANNSTGLLACLDSSGANCIPSGGGGGTPGGVNGNIQWNNAGVFAGISGSSVSSIGETTFQTPARTGGSASAFSVIAGSDTALAADTESVYGRFLSTTRQFTAGAGTFTTQREWIFGAPTYAFTSADTITNAATVAISGPPVPGTNATLTNVYTLWLQAGNLQLGTAATSGSNIRFYNASNSNVLTLSSGATSTSYTWTFPLAAPGGTQCLQMDSSGNVTTTGSGCGSGSAQPFPDDIAILKDNVDNTKLLRIEVGGITTGTTRVFTAQDTSMIMAGTNILQTFTREQSFVPVARSGTQTFYFRIQTPADSPLTADTESLGVILSGNSTAGTVVREWTAGGGSFTTQREIVVAQPTYAFLSADTITTAASFAIIGAPIAGTNATITNPFALWVQAGNSRLDGRIGVNVNPTAQLMVNSANDGDITASFGGTASATASVLTARRGSTPMFTVESKGEISFTPVALTTSTGVAFAYTGAAHTGLSNVEYTDFGLDMSRTITFSGGGGAIAAQRSFRLLAPTLAASAAQTITLAATFAVGGAPGAGTNITITTPLTAWFQTGNVRYGTPSSATGAIQFAVSGDADVITLQGGDAPDATLTYKWPTTSPTASQVLQATAPSGGVVTLSWATVSGGSGCTVAGSQGDYQINNGAGGCAAGVITQGTNGRLVATPTAITSGVTGYLRLVTPADTDMTTDTESIGVCLGGTSACATVTRNFVDGTTLALQREIVVPGITYSFDGATTVTTVASLALNPPVAGTNATFTNPYSLLIQSGNVGLDTASQVTWNHDTTLVRGNPRNVDLRAPGTHSGEACYRTYGSFNSSTQFRRLKLCAVNFGAFIGTEQQNESNISITFQIGASSYGALNTDGKWNFGNGSSATGQVHVISQAAGTIGLEVDSASASTTDTVLFVPNVDDTSTVANVFSINTSSSGTAANNFGAAWAINLEASTGSVLAASQFSVNWTNATAANATADYSIALMDNASGAEKFRLRANGQILYFGLKRATSDLVKTSDVSNSVITGLSFNVVTGRTYYVKFIVFANWTASTGGGAKVVLNGTATFSAILGSGYAMGTETVQAMVAASPRRTTGLGNTLAEVINTNTSTGGTLYGEATLVCNGSGTLEVRAGQQTSDADSTTFLTNSTMEVWEISN